MEIHIIVAHQEKFADAGIVFDFDYAERLVVFGDSFPVAHDDTAHREVATFECFEIVQFFHAGVAAIL